MIYAWDFDAGFDELRRRIHMLAADPGWSPHEQIAGEDAAIALLYSGLDDEQMVTYRSLVDAGVLPAGVGRADRPVRVAGQAGVDPLSSL